MKFFNYLILLIFPSVVLAALDLNCFIAKEEGKVLKEEGDCAKAYPPQSTFKLPLSLLGFDSGILESEERPSWPFKEGYDAYVNVCKGDHNPKTWMRDSCLWYSRVLTQKLGMEKFKSYIEKFEYGNKDLAGQKGQNNGLSHAWISSSLVISPKEQIDFLEKLAKEKVHPSIKKKSYELTKKIMYIQELSGGWKLYGKTGNADLHGWFVGYIEKGKRVIVFASHLVDKEKQKTYASLRARNEAFIKIFYLINELEA